MRVRAKIESRRHRGQAGRDGPVARIAHAAGRATRLAAGGLAALALLTLAACDESSEAGTPAPVEADSAALLPRQTRELIFTGRRAGEPLVVSLTFRTVDGESGRSREMRGWLGHGQEWETFLDERWSGGRFGSAWSIVPHDALRIAAGAAGEVETLWYEEGGRRLRLSLGQPAAEWNRGSTARALLHGASLSVGGEVTRGTVLELLQLRRPREDPPSLVEHLVLTSGDSLKLVVAVETPGGGATGSAVAWLQQGGSTREWTEVRLVPRGGRPLPEARREIPRGWGLVVPEAGIRGEIRPLGFAAEIGLERAGRRGVEARYTVTGWLDFGGGQRVPVSGLARHSVN